MVITANAIRRSLVIRERAKVEGKGKRDWLHNDYPASRGLSLAWLLACTKSLASLVTVVLGVSSGLKGCRRRLLF